MKTQTEKILVVLKILAWFGAIGFSIECGSQLLSFVSSFINLEWSKHTLAANPDIFRLRQYSAWYYINTMSLIIVVVGLKAFIWYRIVALLITLKLKAPFTKEVAKKIEIIAYLLFSVWGISVIMKYYLSWLTKTTGVTLSDISPGDEYLFMAGIIYIISQIFKRGIEIQSENELTV